jgi:hypothetical protein
MVAKVGIVDRHHPVEIGEHPKKPGAAAARGAEDPQQSILMLAGVVHER